MCVFLWYCDEEAQRGGTKRKFVCRSMGTKRRKMRTFKMRTHKSSDLCVEVWAQRGDKKRRRQKERKMVVIEYYYYTVRKEMKIRRNE